MVRTPRFQRVDRGSIPRSDTNKTLSFMRPKKDLGRKIYLNDKLHLSRLRDSKNAR